MWIKICGNTNLEDARLAVKLGADALGFVFGPSKRQVNAGQVAGITRQLPAQVAKIGVFQTQDFEEIAGTIREAGLTGAQLHGGFSPELIAALRREFYGALGEPGTLFIIQTTHWKNEGQTAEAFRAELDQLRHGFRHRCGDGGFAYGYGGGWHWGAVRLEGCSCGVGRAGRAAA